MPRKPQKLHFDRVKGSWVEKPTTAVDEWKKKNDDFYGGLIIGACASGVLSVLVYGLGLLI